jgi:molybdopterin/thiamine biosynthesis adenylyltransferase
VNLDTLSARLVVVVGVGSVGSPLARNLVASGVGHLLLVDGDVLEPANVARHELPGEYIGWNKAEAMAVWLSKTFHAADIRAYPHHFDHQLADAQVDALLTHADLIVIATHNREAQRRVARRALALDIPAVVPGLYEDGGGEVFVQLGPAQACFMCWDAFRQANADVRDVSALNADGMAVVQQAVLLSLGVLDPTSEHARPMAGINTDRRPRQLFVIRPYAALSQAPVQKRPGCGACQVGPSASVAQSADSWRHAQNIRTASTTIGGTAARDALSDISPVARAIADDWETFFETLWGRSRTYAMWLLVPMLIFTIIVHGGFNFFIWVLLTAFFAALLAIIITLREVSGPP